MRFFLSIWRNGDRHTAKRLLCVQLCHWQSKLFRRRDYHCTCDWLPLLSHSFPTVLITLVCRSQQLVSYVLPEVLSFVWGIAIIEWLDSVIAIPSPFTLLDYRRARNEPKAHAKQIRFNLFPSLYIDQPLAPISKENSTIVPSWADGSRLGFWIWRQKSRKLLRL